MENNNISRKDFLKVVGATTAVSAIALSGCKSETYDKETTYSLGDIPKDKMTYRINHIDGAALNVLLIELEIYFFQGGTYGKGAI